MNEMKYYGKVAKIFPPEIFDKTNNEVYYNQIHNKLSKIVNKKEKMIDNFLNRA